MSSSSLKLKVCLLALLTGLLFTVLPARAQEQVISKLKAYKVTVMPDKSEKLTAADKAKPGEVLEYQLTYANHGKAKVSNLQATLPIPPGTEYQMGSAKPADARASLDGKTFQTVPLKRMLKAANGKSQEVTVPASEYRYLLWIVPQLNEGKEVILKARVKISQAAPAPVKVK